MGATSTDVFAGKARWGVDHGHVVDRLAAMPAGSVHCCATSPPYWALRSYLIAGDPLKAFELGSEPTPDEYVANMVAVFREVRRVLHSSGTLWLNVGDSYANDPKGPNAASTSGLDGRPNLPSVSKSWRNGDLKKKDLVGIPWMLAFALRADGWYLRQDIIWHKPAPMPSSVRDRCTTAHEYLFLLSKSPAYFFDAEAICEAASPNTHPRGKGVNPKAASADRTLSRQNASFSAAVSEVLPTRNKRSVWRVASAPFKGAHFATFPPKLVEPCILAGSSARGVCPACGEPWVRVMEKERRPTRPGVDVKYLPKSDGDMATAEAMGWNRPQVIGNRDPQRHCTVTRSVGWKAGCRCESGEPVPAVVLDPFAGSGTTLSVAVQHGRRAVGVELNADYLPLIERRMATVQPEFAC